MNVVVRSSTRRLVVQYVEDVFLEVLIVREGDGQPSVLVEEPQKDGKGRLEQVPFAELAIDLTSSDEVIALAAVGYRTGVWEERREHHLLSAAYEAMESEDAIREALEREAWLETVFDGPYLETDEPYREADGSLPVLAPESRPPEAAPVPEVRRRYFVIDATYAPSHAMYVGCPRCGATGLLYTEPGETVAKRGPIDHYVRVLRCRRCDAVVASGRTMWQPADNLAGLAGEAPVGLEGLSTVEPDSVAVGAGTLTTAWQHLMDSDE